MKLSKICTKCDAPKPLSEFSLQKTGKFGKRPECKLCRKVQRQEYYKQNTEKVKVKARLYRESNLDVIREKQRVYYREHANKLNEKRRQARRTDNKHKKVRNEYARKRKVQDPLYKLSCNMRTLLGEAFRRQGYSKKTKTSQILGCSFEELKQHLRLSFELNYGLPFSQIDTTLLHVDHIIPLSTAKTEVDIIKLNHYSNLQYLFAEDNLDKGNSLDWKL